jgi:hypothetical protein
MPQKLDKLSLIFSALAMDPTMGFDEVQRQTSVDSILHCSYRFSK